MQMDAEPINMPLSAPKRTSKAAITLFIIAALGISALVLFGQLVVWNLEQSAIADETFAALANAGKIWFLAQALIVAALCGIGVAVSKERVPPGLSQLAHRGSRYAAGLRAALPRAEQ